MTSAGYQFAKELFRRRAGWLKVMTADTSAPSRYIIHWRTGRSHPAAGIGRIRQQERSDVHPTYAIQRPALLAIALVIGIAGCLKPPAPLPSDPMSTGRVLVTVNNNYRSDVTIYVIGDGQPVRVGTATAAATSNFDIASRLLGQGRQLRLRADPIGARNIHTSELIRVGPGQRVEWTLETDLSRSSVAVY